MAFEMNLKSRWLFGLEKVSSVAAGHEFPE